MKLFVTCLLPAFLFWSGFCYGQVKDIQIVNGKCASKSHIAEGKIGTDLTKRQSKFFCDSAVISFFDNGNRHIMIQFAESQSVTNSQLGFAGLMEDDGRTLDVTSVYLGGTKIQGSDLVDSVCKLDFQGKHMTQIFCGAAIDQQGRRTVPFVLFNAAPDQ